MRGELVERGALAVAALGDDEQVAVRLDDVERLDHVAVVQADTPDACGGPAHRAHLLLREAQRAAARGHDHELLPAARCSGPAQLVARLQVHRDDAAGPHVRKLAELDALDAALPRQQRHILGIREIGHDEHGRDALLRGQVEEVDQRQAAAIPRCVRQRKDPLPVDPAPVGKEEQVVERVRGDEVHDLVLVLRAHALHAPASAPLCPVESQRRALDVAGLRHADEDGLLPDQVLLGEVACGLRHDDRAPLVRKPRLEVEHLILDDAENARRVAQQLLVVLDLAEEGLVLVLDFLAFERGQPAQLHVEDGLGLPFAQPEARDELMPGIVRAVRGADDVDDLVEELQRDAQPFQDVRPLARLAEQVVRPPDDDVDAVVHVNLERALEAEQPGLAVDQGQHVDAEGGLQRRVLEELVEHLARGRAPLELDDDVHPLAVRLVAQVADVGDAALAHQLRDAFEQGGLVELVGDRGDDDTVTAAAAAAAIAPAAGHLLDARGRAHDDAALARAVGQLDFLAAHDQCTGREVGSLDELHELIHGNIFHLAPAVDQEHDGIAQFTEVVGRDVGGHADCNAAVAVEQEVGQQRGQHRRFLEAAVEVVVPVDGLFFDVGDQRLGDAGQAGLGVAHGCRRVAVHRAEVALAVHQGVAQAEVLGHAGHGVVDRAVAVRVILAEHLTDDTGGLAVRCAGAVAHVIHRVDDAALDGLHPVARVGQCPRDDNTHRVVQIGPAHLLVDADRPDNPQGAGCSFNLIIHSPFLRPSRVSHDTLHYYTSERSFGPFTGERVKR